MYHKALLPNYAVFDEVRYFKAGEGFPLFDLDGVVFGVSVCEDIWYPAGPPEKQAAAGAELLVNISASPYHLGKIQERERMLATRAADNVAVVAFCNQVGGWYGLPPPCRIATVPSPRQSPWGLPQEPRVLVQPASPS